MFQRIINLGNMSKFYIESYPVTLEAVNVAIVAMLFIEKFFYPLLVFVQIIKSVLIDFV